MNTKKTNLTRIDSILKGNLKSLKLDDSIKVYPIWKNWNSIVGDAISQKTHPDFVTGKTLTISVSHPVWMNELQMQKRTLLKKINEMNLEFTLENIRFRLKKGN